MLTASVFMQGGTNMSVPIHHGILLPAHDTRLRLFKWVIALLVPVAIFTFVWSGEEIINNVLLGLFRPGSTVYDTGSLIQATILSQRSTQQSWLSRATLSRLIA